MARERTNRLVGETSPYLLQHAHNPVDWYPWGPEALARAAAEDRPIFLSVGYAACHWCHVMERESFEDEETATVLNEGFVAVKVDREERPDIDSVYMAAVQAMTGSGGWPMSVFLAPDGRPFYGGTFYPAEPRYGIPSFRQVLEAVAETWRDRRSDVESTADRLAEELRRKQALPPGAGEAVADAPQGVAASPGGVAADMGPAPSGEPRSATTVNVGGVRIGFDRAGLDPASASRAASRLVAEFDHENGGWGGPPRFPQPALIELLLRRASGGDDGTRGAALRALDVMAAGGIHDHLGGGFHRYATDTKWLVPHFEKMLYDNAQLARVYLHAYGLTGEQLYRDVAQTTLDYMGRELLTPDELFAASQDADTDGVEGATYVWTLAEIEAVFGVDGVAQGSSSGGRAGRPREAGTMDSAAFRAAYGVTGSGNWEGRSILSRVADDGDLAKLLGLTSARVAAILAAGRDVLLERRQLRPQPALDDKAITAWNGLALAAFAEAVPLLGRPEDLATAEALASSSMRLLRGPDGRLARSYRSGRATGTGGLDDYACLADGLLALYEATFEEGWLTAARELMEIVDRHFADPDGGWYDTADDAERLVLRPRDTQDGATPSGGAAAAAVTLRLAELTGEGRLRHAAERALAQIEPLAERYPRAFGAWLCALDFATSPIAQVAIVGDLATRPTQALVAVARSGYQPHRVVAVGEPQSSAVELIQGRFLLRGLPTAFVCRDFACRQPVTEPAALAAELA